MLNPCARETKARIGRFLREKLIPDHGIFASYEGRQGAANGQDSWRRLRLHHHGLRYFNFPYLCMMCGLEKLELVHQNWLERDLLALLLRTLAADRRHQSESIRVALDVE